MRRGFTEAYYALHEGPEGPDGYVAYAVKGNWGTGIAEHMLEVRELITVTPEAYADLWRYCFDVDLVATIEGDNRRPDEPLLHLLAHPRYLKLQTGEGLWLRIVDVPKALTARRYSAEGRLVIEVRDAFCPWNEGAFELSGGPDGAECRRTEDPADLSLDVAALGAAFLGGNRFSSLGAAGRVGEATPGALGRADAMFTWDPTPWCPEVF
jgi:predicted acetyltransferase